jgi:hypothetical protein
MFEFMAATVGGGLFSEQAAKARLGAALGRDIFQTKVRSLQDRALLHLLAI